MRRTRKASHRQIEAGRTVLALVMTVRIKFANLIVASGMLEDIDDCPIDFSITPPASLVSKFPRVSHVDEHEPMFDSGDLILVAPKPSDRADGSGNKDKSV